jgi:hypothetical protein
MQLCNTNSAIVKLNTTSTVVHLLSISLDILGIIMRLLRHSPSPLMTCKTLYNLYKDQAMKISIPSMNIVPLSYHYIEMLRRCAKPNSWGPPQFVTLNLEEPDIQDPHNNTAYLRGIDLFLRGFHELKCLYLLTSLELRDVALLPELKEILPKFSFLECLHIENSYLSSDSSEVFLDCKCLKRLYLIHVFHPGMRSIVLCIPENMIELILKGKYEKMGKITINGKNCAKFTDL